MIDLVYEELLIERFKKIDSNCDQADDVDDYSKTAFGDSKWILNYLFGKGNETKTPFKGRGQDSTNNDPI